MKRMREEVHEFPETTMCPTRRSRQDVRVTYMSGEEIVVLRQVDLAATTGRELKGMVAQAAGFPALHIRLICSSGALSDFSVLEKSFGQNSYCDGSADLTVTCVLTPLKPLGPKRERDVYFGSKAGMLLKRRLNKADTQGQAVNLRNPDPCMRAEVLRLIKSSFASEQERLIEMALAAAYHDSPCMVYESEQSGDTVSVDLSNCCLWTRTVTLQDHPRQLQAFSGQEKCLVGAVLWRLLSGWMGSASNTPGGAVPAGPVLEVLFLATSVGLREGGQALKLISELEEIASEMGCAAMAVAAVPVQGHGFWTRNGFEVVVPLKDLDDVPSNVAVAKPADPPGLGEPLTELGVFLLDQMLLFTDTPLVAKVLHPKSKKETVTDADLGVAKALDRNSKSEAAPATHQRGGDPHPDLAKVPDPKLMKEDVSDPRPADPEVEQRLHRHREVESAQQRWYMTIPTWMKLVVQSIVRLIQPSKLAVDPKRTQPHELL
eukprot:gnl/MRDRNA2_/MRDRNA2_138131_c0_seq1.p1 gnl/MRDRNA2_/MRDRNA2_138131_c0~~gnl/MRDRNA2_/MRDRNA2_138131_c0_seq1.p1  ORF type:complete len:489 (-),score=86.54 gnl/MRDRNA2_/MRDRNA2_138131_c0_seq1:24-1490(-)